MNHKNPYGDEFSRTDPPPVAKVLFVTIFWAIGLTIANSLLLFTGFYSQPILWLQAFMLAWASGAFFAFAYTISFIGVRAWQQGMVACLGMVYAVALFFFDANLLFSMAMDSF